jgi:putative methylase
MLEKVKPHPKPSLILEQYQTPPSIAATLLHTAAYSFDDIAEKTICDLGCGTGILAIGAAILDANYVVGADLDFTALKVARENAEKFKVKIDWVAGCLESLKGPFDTVIENPPFGVHRRGIDVVFLQKALSLAPIVYSIHKAGNRAYLEKRVLKNQAKITAVFKAKIIIPHMFSFHRKLKKEVEVEIYRVEKLGSKFKN